jgi:flavodoxin
MPSIVILYDTTEGQTRKIAQHVYDVVSTAGHQVGLHDIGQREYSNTMKDKSPQGKPQSAAWGTERNGCEVPAHSKDHRGTQE